MNLDTIAEQLLTLDHWPWVAVCAILTVIGQFASLKLFTRERAYDESAGKAMRQIWFWGRETLVLHPLCASALISIGWLDPEGKGWTLAPTLAYFGSAAVASLFAWSYLKARAKKKGINLELPGMSAVPRPPKSESPKSEDEELAAGDTERPPPEEDDTKP